MANSLYTPQQAATSVLAALRYLSVLPRTVRQDFSQEFVAGRGQTVNVKGPVSVGAARTLTAAQRAARSDITFDDITDTTYPVSLTDQVYKAVRLPDDFNTFTLQQLEQQVLKPQAESVATGVVAPLVSTMSATSRASAVPLLQANGSNARAALIAARRVLNSRQVPADNRYLAVGPGAEAAILNDELLQKVADSGTDGLLREATIGRLFGFTIVSAPELPDYLALAYNADAFAHVTRPSRAPEGAAKSATVAQDGFALRWLQHYNASKLEDQSVVDTFAAASKLDPLRALAFGTKLVGSNITATASASTIDLSDGQTSTITVVDDDGTVIPNRLITWSTSNAGRATVDADGVVHPVAAGTAATITASFDGQTATASVAVQA